jgi:ribosomal subunit interface protein
MKLIYSGKTKDFTPEIEEKIGAKLSKLSKFVEQRGERDAYISHHVERHLHKVKIKVQFYDHAVLAEGSDSDLEICLFQAIEKLETQLVEIRSRWRDTQRDPKGIRTNKERDHNAVEPPVTPVASGKSSANNGSARKPRIFRVNYDNGQKPMTLEEAILEMEGESEYIVYRDSEKNCLSVLVRRPDGNLDLIES